MSKISNEQPIFECSIALKAHTVASGTLNTEDSSAIYPDVDLVVDDLVETRGLCIGLIDIVDKASGRVNFLEYMSGVSEQACMTFASIERTLSTVKELNQLA